MEKELRPEKLSGRQLSLAVLVGGLSAAAAAAGRADWRWMLAAVPVGTLLGWALLSRTKGRPLYRGAAGRALAVAYGGWAALLMAETLRRSAERLQAAFGGGRAGWFMVLLALPLLWMGRGRTAAFLRAVEIFWLAAAVTVGAILLLGAFRVEGRCAFQSGGSWWESMLAGLGVMAAGLFALPHCHLAEEESGGRGEALGWLAGLGLTGAALAGLTAGILSPAVAGELDRPFFVMAGLLGGSARLEGLISALWLLPDLTFLGLLSRSWGEQPRPALAALTALALALSGLTAGWPGWTAPAGSLVLVILTMALPGGGKR